ncbi:MAG: HEAT repeat domain-containing protein [Bacillota bacterium]
MRRLTTVLLLLAVCAGVSCVSNKQDKEEREDWGDKQWQQALLENQERLKSEDERKKQVTFAFLSRAKKTITDTVVQIYNYITGNTAFNAAKDMLDPSYPDRRRKAVVYLSKRDFGRQDPYVKYYAEMARADDDHTVRAMAIRAMNRARRKDATSLYLQALEDSHPLVRLEAAKALANIPDEASIPALIKHLKGRIEVLSKGKVEAEDETTDVRVACADALRTFRTTEVAQALVGVLRDRDFAVCWQARISLKLMTGKDFRYDQSAWLDYLTTWSGGE